MAGWKYYVRFDNRTYFGGSKYRPSEGWIDVVGFVPWRPYGTQGAASSSGGNANVNRTGSLDVDCVTDKATVLLLQAHVSGQLRVGNAVVELRSGDAWIRYTLTDVVLANAKTQGKKASFTVECKEPTYRSNAKSAAHR